MGKSLTYQYVLRVFMALMHIGAVIAFLPYFYSWLNTTATVLVWLITGIVGITAGYHRLLTHNSYKVSPVVRRFFALMGTLAMQGGPVWWVEQHRHHHQYSDTEHDLHSPKKRKSMLGAFFWAHFGWMISSEEQPDVKRNAADLRSDPGIMWIENHVLHIHIAQAIGFFALGSALAALGFATSGFQLFMCGFVRGIVVTWHATWSVNSLTHMWGARPFETDDDSRNNWLVAILAGGEGWHNNHHAHPKLARHGLTSWELDPTYWLLCALQRCGIVKEMTLPNEEVYAEYWATTRIREDLRVRLNERLISSEQMAERLAAFVEELSTARKKMAGIRAKAQVLLRDGKLKIEEYTTQISEGWTAFVARVEMARVRALA